MVAMLRQRLADTSTVAHLYDQAIQPCVDCPGCKAGAPDCDLTIEMFRRACEALGMTFLVAVTAEAYDMGEVDTDPEVAQALDALAATINADA